MLNANFTYLTIQKINKQIERASVDFVVEEDTEKGTFTCIHILRPDTQYVYPIHTHTHIHTKYTQLHTRTPANTIAHNYAHTFICSYNYIQLRIQLHLHIKLHTHRSTHTSTHTQVHTQLHTPKSTRRTVKRAVSPDFLIATHRYQCDCRRTGQGKSNEFEGMCICV